MTSEDKRYVQLPRSSISLFAESDGHAALSDPVASLLAEDANYRLRLIIQNASLLMRHSKRKRLTTSDINHALHWSQVEPLYGYGSPEALNSTFVREADLFVPEDNEVNLMSVATEDTAQPSLKAPSLKMQWLVVEGIMKGDIKEQQAVSSDTAESQSGSQTPSTNDPLPKKNPVIVQQQLSNQQTPVSEALMAYYDHITQAVLGSDQELLLCALEDLRTNDRIAPLLPYLLNLVSVGVKKLGHDLTQLTKLLHAIECLIDNPSLYFGTQPYLTLLVQSVLYCALEPLAASLNPNHDHWTFRKSAARLLAHILKLWSTSTNQLWWHTGFILRDCFGDFSKPFSTHYGALISLQAMGIQEVETLVLPKLDNYWPHLRRALEGGGVSAQVRADAHKVRGTLLLLSELLLRRRLKSEFPESWNLQERELGYPMQDIQPPRPPEPRFSIKQEFPNKSQAHENSLTLYKKLYEIFGDALAIRLPYLPTVAGLHILPDRKPHSQLFTSPELMQTGEQLLEAFYEGVCEEDSARSPANSMDEDNSYEENSPLSDEAPAIELQIRSTISDPALGIKLTIAKLRRDQTPVVKEPTKGSKRKRTFNPEPGSVEVFDRCFMKPRFQPLFFNFEGSMPIPLEELRRHTFSPPTWLPESTWNVSIKMKKTGRKKCQSVPSLRQSCVGDLHVVL